MGIYIRCCVINQKKHNKVDEFIKENIVYYIDIQSNSVYTLL